MSGDIVARLEALAKELYAQWVTLGAPVPVNRTMTWEEWPAIHEYYIEKAKVILKFVTPFFADAKPEMQEERERENVAVETFYGDSEYCGGAWANEPEDQKEYWRKKADRILALTRPAAHERPLRAETNLSQEEYDVLVRDAMKWRTYQPNRIELWHRKNIAAGNADLLAHEPTLGSIPLSIEKSETEQSRPAPADADGLRDIAGEVWDLLLPYLPLGNRTALYDEMREEFPIAALGPRKEGGT